MKLHFCLLAVLATAASAGPFNPKDVAANPAVLAHIDCDAFRASSVGQKILEDPEAQQKIAALATLFGFDVRTQLHGLTIYTTEDHPQDGALIVYADFDPARLIAMAQLSDTFTSETNGSRVIYSWVDEKKKLKEGGEPRVYAAIIGNRVVFGENESHLAQALTVIDGKASNYSGKNGMPDHESGESVLAEGVLRKFDFNTADPNTALLKMAKSARMKISEGKDSIRASLRLEARDSSTAAQMSALAQGLLAFVKLQQTDTNALALADAVKVDQYRDFVTVSFSQPSSAVAGMIKAEKKKEQAGHSGPDATNPADNK